MSRQKSVIALCIASFALMGLSASAAIAGEWDVGGTKLAGTAALPSSTRVLEHGKFVVVGAGVTIECLGQEIGIAGGELVAPDEVRAKSLTFKECTVTGGPCTLEQENLTSLPAHGLAELEGPLNTLVKVLPLPSKTFMVIHFLGASCALLGIQPITGSFDYLIHNGHDPAVLQQILVFSLKGSLKIGSDEAELTGLVVDLQLASGNTWNFL